METNGKEIIGKESLLLDTKNTQENFESKKRIEFRKYASLGT